MSASSESSAGRHFLRQIIEADLASGKHTQVVTRFPPEPNGYLHIGHAKAICVDFGLAAHYGGRCHLRFDDTNPEKESTEYVESIQRDVRWLGFDWGENLFFASDYFPRLYEFAEELVKKGLAYVCFLPEDEMRAYRGTVREAGRPSPTRDTSPDENLALLRKMRDGAFPEGHCVLRAKIDMAAPNMKMRDPPIYRIRKVHHHRTGDDWCIYPLYDFTHCLSDSLEHITHSFCTLEFENNRELYDWFLAQLDVPSHPRQIEFARLALSYTVMSKRKLVQLVEDGHVTGWDDPRLPTLAGLRRAGVPPEALRALVEMAGVSKSAHSMLPVGEFERLIRDELNQTAARRMVVSRPLEVVIDNYPENHTETLTLPDFPNSDRPGSREVPFGRRIWIEADDFSEDPPRGWRRLSPGAEVRLRGAYFIRCTAVERDEQGQIVRLRATYDPASRGGASPDGRKVKGTLHWAPGHASLPVELRVYDRLFRVPRPGADRDYLEDLNPDSLTVLRGKAEPALRGAAPGSRFQFERVGYFVVDPDTSSQGLVFNRTVALRDSWGKEPAATEARPARPRPAPQKAVEVVRSPEEIARRDALAARGVPPAAAGVIAADEELRSWFERGGDADPAELAKLVVGPLAAERKDRSLSELPFGPDAVASLAGLVAAGTLTRAAAREVWQLLCAEGGSPEQLMKREGLVADSGTDEIAQLVDGVLESAAAEVARYRAGERKLMGFFMGQVMRASRGKARPDQVRALLQERLA